MRKSNRGTHVGPATPRTASAGRDKVNNKLPRSDCTAREEVFRLFHTLASQRARLSPRTDVEVRLWIILACGSGVRTGTIIASIKRKREQRKKSEGLGTTLILRRRATLRAFPPSKV